LPIYFPTIFFWVDVVVAEITRLIEAAERVLATEHRMTVPLTIIRRKVA